MEPMLELKKISKDFGEVRVLFGIDFALMKGEVHAVIGENGAGKSTMMKIISGYHQPTEGEILLHGKPVIIENIRRGEELGIVMIHQELNLAEDLRVEENIFLGREKTGPFFLHKKEMQEESLKILQKLKTPIDPKTKVRDLSISNKQMVEIAKAVSRDASILIMDEPTSALTRSEIQVLFDLVRSLKEDGVSIIFISHKLDEVKEIADRTTVLRDGEHIVTTNTRELTQEDMANLMVGRDLKDMYPEKGVLEEEETVLRVQDLSVPGYASDASFHLQKGEILGFAGLVGAGRTELLEGLVGLRPKSAGRVWIEDREVDLSSYARSVEEGLVYLSEDRKGRSLHTSFCLCPNLTLLALENFCHPFVHTKEEQEALNEALKEFDIKVPHVKALVNTLSGGNQQKLALAKIMERAPSIIILDEPTRGIDVGTKKQIYYFIKELTKEGMSCIVVSSELQEIIGLCNRVVVMRDGLIMGILEEGDIEEAEIMRYATGLKGAS